MNGQFTYLTGESGCGKSSILKTIANMDVSKVSGYNFNGIDIFKLSQEEVNQIRKKFISYVSQDEPMIKNYTLMENVQLILESKGQHLNHSKLYELMEKLKISKSKLNKKLSTLSNGERQRFSVICSLLGDYELYLYDEPASSLDETNKKVVIDLLKELVSSNKMVVIAQHKINDNNQGINYYIENKKICCEKLIEDKNKNDSFINDYSVKNNRLLIKEAINNITHMPYFNSICLIALSICIALTSMFITHSFEIFNIQTEALNDLYDKELFLINDSTSASNFSVPYDELSTLPIDDETYERIKSIEHVKSIEPNFYLTLEQFQYKEDGKIDVLNMDELGEIVLSQNDEIKKSISYKSLGIQKILVGPTFEHQKFDDRCRVLNAEQEGIYITSDLAKSLGIENINNCSLTINVSIPIASEIGVKEIDRENQKFEVIRGPITVLKEITLPIRGILKRISTNSYLSGDSPTMYLSIETIKSLMQETREENIKLINNLNSIKITDSLINQFSDKLLLSDNWKASAYVLEIDNYQNLAEVKTEIMKISNNLLIRDSYFNGTTTSALVNQQKILSIGLSLLLIIFTLILIMFINYFKIRKKVSYYAYLQRLGWSKREVVNLIKMESFIYTLLLMPLTGILLVFINKYLFSQITVNLFTVLIGLCIFGILLLIQRMGINKKIKKIMEV